MAGHRRSPSGSPPCGGLGSAGSAAACEYGWSLAAEKRLSLEVPFLNVLPDLEVGNGLGGWCVGPEEKVLRQEGGPGRRGYCRSVENRLTGPSVQEACGPGGFMQTVWAGVPGALPRVASLGLSSVSCWSWSLCWVWEKAWSLPLEGTLGWNMPCPPQLEVSLGTGPFLPPGTGCASFPDREQNSI